jgi:hypothetical protein
MMWPRSCAEKAVKVVEDAGGVVTFDEYDRLMWPIRYISPVEWIAGWGNPTLHKANNDKLCAFAAVKLGLLKQTETGYALCLTSEFVGMTKQ